MKRMVSKLLSIALMCVMLLQIMAPAIAFARMVGDVPSTVDAPAGYEPNNTYLNAQTMSLRSRAVDNSTPKVLLIEDVNPWDSVANQVILGGITQYDKVTTREFLDVALEEYGVVVFANDQPFSTYENYAEFKEYLEIFASIGGVIVFGACDAGWSNGQLIEKLPGDVTKKTHYVINNYVANNNHAIIGGRLTEGTVLQNKDLVSNYCSHVSFDEKSLPAGSTVILRESTTNRPTLVEYPLGKGRVIASGLTWEHNYDRGGGYSSTVGGYTGRFAKIAMEDMFRYAIRVSSIQVDELNLLKEWRMRREAHGIVVAEAGCDMTDLSPIVGATVTINNDTLTTDANGQVFYYDYGMKTVSVSASGYREQKIRYSLQQSASQIFFLEKQRNDGKPYMVQVDGYAAGTGRVVDLRSQALHFNQNDSSRFLMMEINGNWNGHKAGKITLYQGSSLQNATKTLTIDENTAFNFAPGMFFEPEKAIKLQMVAADGTVSDPIEINIAINKTLPQNNSSADNAIRVGDSQLDWPGTNDTTKSNDIFEFLGTNGSISSELLNLTIEREVNEDGTVTYKGLIGMGKGDAVKNVKYMKTRSHDFKEESPWDTLKDEIKRFKKAGNPIEYWKALEKKYKKDLKGTWVRQSVNYELGALGFIELVYDQNGQIISSDGGIIVNGGIDYVEGRTVFWGPVPVYYEVSGGAKAEADLGVHFYDDGDGTAVALDSDGAKVTLSLTAGGGVGVRGVATAGVEGTGALSTQFLDWDAQNGRVHTRGKLLGSGSVKVKLIFVAEFKKEFLSGEIELWDSSKAQSYALLALVADDEERAKKTLASREYLSSETAWNPYTISTLVRNGSDSSLTTLQEGVMPDALPQLHQIGNKLVLLFVQDVAQRSVGNHTRLVYSVYENGMWSNPVPVWESTTADFFYDSAVVNDQLYVTWQKSSKAQTSTDPDELLKQVTEASEICLAVWDDSTNSFVQQQYVTNDAAFDMMPTVAANGDAVSVVWASSDQNNVVASGANYTIHRADYRNGMLVGKEELYTTDQYLAELCAGYSNGKLQVLYTTVGTDGTNSVYSIQNGQARALKSGSSIAGLTFESNVFLWQADGVLYNYNPNSQKVGTLYAAENGGASSSFQCVGNESDDAIVWHEAGDTASIKASVYENGQWSEPVVLLEGLEDNIAYQDAVMLDDGRYAVIMNTANYNANGLESTSLKFALIAPKSDVELVSAFVDKPDWEKQQQELTLSLKNNGTKAVSEVNVTVSEGIHTYFNKNVKVDLMPGEEVMVTEMMDVSDISSVITADVEVNAARDDVPENNTAEITLGTVDVAFTIDAYERNDDIMFLLTVANNANTTANTALSIIEDSADGIVVDVKNIGSVNNKECVQYLYSMDKSKIDFGDDGLKTYFFVLDSLEKDWNEADNQRTYTVSQVPEGRSGDHAYGEPVFNWSDNYLACTATFDCYACEQTETLPCSVKVETFEANGNEPAKTVYTATVTFRGQTYTDVKTVNVASVPVTGDNSTPVLWFGAMVCAMIGIVILASKSGITKRYNH